MREGWNASLACCCPGFDEWARVRSSGQRTERRCSGLQSAAIRLEDQDPDPNLGGLQFKLGHNLAANQTNGEIWVPDYQSKSVLVFAPVTSLGGGTK